MCGVEISRFIQNDIFAHINFGVLDIAWHKIIKIKLNADYLAIFLLKNALWHPRRNNLNEMPQCIVQLKGIVV